MRRILTIVYCLLLIAYCEAKMPTKLIIWHTDDVHSQVEPNSKNQGGYARLDELLCTEKRNLVMHNLTDKKHPWESLLVDDGDFCQGTPYFNLYKGRMEIDFMNMEGYEVATFGNHEFDNGLDTLAMLVRRAHFPFVCANYDFTNTPLRDLVKPYIVLQKRGLRIGIFGLGVNPKSLIADKNVKGMKYLDPLEVTQPLVDKLRREEKCDIVICLSHLGYQNEMTGFSDEDLISKTHGIDALVGGHTHKLITTQVKNNEGKEVPVPQMKKSGVYLGKITLNLGK